MTIPEMAGSILAKCIEVNGIEGHDHGDSNRPNVFFEFMGHVGKIKICYCPNGWQKGEDWTLLDCGYEWTLADLTESTYNEIMAQLEEIESHASEIAVDCDSSNLDALLSLKDGDAFLLTLPTGRVVRGVALTVDGKRRFDVEISKVDKGNLTHRQIRGRLRKLQAIMRGDE